MDIESLRRFVGLCRNLHFGRTSDEFHTSPSALSRLVSRLEAETGQRLLFRDNRTVRITPEGEMFRQFALETISRWEKLQVDLGLAHDDLSGRLTLFASVTASQSILPDVLSRFRERYPDIHLQLETGYAVNALQRLDEGADVVVAALPSSDDRRLERRILRSIPILAVAPRGVVPAGVVSEGVDWSRVPLVLPARGQGRDDIDTWLRSIGVRPNVYGEVAGNEAILTLVALGCGVGFVPELVLNDSPLREKVVVLDEQPALPDFQVGFCTRRKYLEASPLVAAFWQTISGNP